MQLYSLLIQSLLAISIVRASSDPITPGPAQVPQPTAVPVWDEFNVDISGDDLKNNIYMFALRTKKAVVYFGQKRLDKGSEFIKPDKEPNDLFNSFLTNRCFHKVDNAGLDRPAKVLDNAIFDVLSNTKLKADDYFKQKAKIAVLSSAKARDTTYRPDNQKFVFPTTSPCASGEDYLTFDFPTGDKFQTITYLAVAICAKKENKGSEDVKYSVSKITTLAVWEELEVTDSTKTTKDKVMMKGEWRSCVKYEGDAKEQEKLKKYIFPQAPSWVGYVFWIVLVIGSAFVIGVFFFVVEKPDLDERM